MTPTPITEDAIRHALPASRQGMDIRLFDELDSTNTHAKRLATDATVTAPILMIARHQTAGRGRLGRSFYSPAHTGLYMTLLYPTTAPLSDAVGITGAAAVAVVRAIEALTDQHPAIKWVNDIYLNDCKVGGILTEAVTPPEIGVTYMLVGIGINIATHAFPEGLRAPATSLTAPNETPPDANALAARITHELLCLVETDPRHPSVVEAYRAHALWMGRRVICTQGHLVFEATVEGIEDDYALRVRRDDGTTMVLTHGEVSIRAPLIN